MAGMVQLADPAGTHGNGRNAPIADLREVAQDGRGLVSARTERSRNLLPQNLGLPTQPHSTRRGEANSNKLRELHRSKLTPGNATTALLLNITRDMPYAVLHLAHEHNIRG